MKFHGWSRRQIMLIGIAALLLYTAWIGGPYFRSIILRDAAVTTWVNVAAAPIAGNVGSRPLYAGARVGSGGRIVTIENSRADRTTLARAEADLERANTRVKTLTDLAQAIRGIVAGRETAAAAYAESFRQDVDREIAGATDTRDFLRRQLDLERNESNRITTLAQRGTASASAADIAMGRMTDRQRALAAIETTLARATRRRSDADRGVFLIEDGTDGAAAQRSLDDARLRLIEVEAELAGAKAETDAAQRIVVAARDAYEKASATLVLAPPGAMVWSLPTAPGAAVEPGTAVALWIDCKILMVDVPVPDVEVGLLHPGSAARVVLEGETRSRPGKVIITRGGASTIGHEDLAAIATGRQPGTGQALVALEPTAGDVAVCPVGAAAYVDFPGVGIIDIILARLRL